MESNQDDNNWNEELLDWLESDTSFEDASIEIPHLNSHDKEIRFEHLNDDDTWEVTQIGDYYILNAPKVQYVFDESDFIELVNKINQIDIFEDDTWFISEETITNRKTGEQLATIHDYCYKLNKMEDENNDLIKFRENVEDTLSSMYRSEKTEFGQKIIKNIANLLEVEL